MSKSPAELLYEDINVNGRIKHVDEMIVLVKTTNGNYILMESSNVSSRTKEEAIKLLQTEV